MSRQRNTIADQPLERYTFQRLQPYHQDKLLLEKIPLAGMVRLIEVERAVVFDMARDTTGCF